MIIQKNIDLLSPDGTENPYYIEFGWKVLGDQNAQLPNLETIWKTDSSILSQENSVRLSWTNDKILPSLNIFLLMKIICFQ